MHNMLRREDLKSIQNLRKVCHRLSLLQWTFRLDNIFQGALVAELIEKVEIVGSFEYLYELNDVRGIDFGEDLYFVEGAFLQFRKLLEFLHIDNLNSHFLFVSGINASIDLSVLPFADLFVEGVIFDDLYHSVSLIV